MVKLTKIDLNLNASSLTDNEMRALVGGAKKPTPKPTPKPTLKPLKPITGVTPCPVDKTSVYQPWRP
mgnify:CR=1 FL=1